jgi:hypothetical protein
VEIEDRFQCTKGSAYPGPESGAGQGPPGAQSPFAHNRRYLLWHDALCHVRGHYPSFIAHTGSCARPNPSLRLRFNYYDGSLQVVASPCWKMALPDIISAILAQVLGPLPRSVLQVLLLASSLETTASPQTSQVRHTKLPLQCNFNTETISGLHSFTNVQAPTLARPPGCTHRSSIKATGQPGLLHHA